MNPDLPEILRQQFQRLRSRIRAVSAAGGVGLTFCIVAASVGLAILIDVLIELPLALRVGLLGTTAIFCCYGIIFLIVRPLTKQVHDEELAAFVEKQFPKLNERLLSTVEFQHDSDPSASPIMKKWLVQETVSYSKKVDFSEAVDASRSIRYCWWAGIACLALILPLLFVGDAYAVLFSRFMNPWGNYERVQNLILIVDDGDRLVAEKSDVEIEAKVQWRFREGTIPDSAWLEWTADNGATQARRIDWNEETESFLGTLPRVETSFTYRVSAQRSRTKSYRIDVAPLPRIEQLQIEISPPAYTGQPAQFHDLALGEIMVVEQSQWDVSAHFNKPVESAEILWLDGEQTGKEKLTNESLADGTPIISKTELRLSGDKMSVTLHEVLALESLSGRFAIRAIDSDGLSSDTDIIRRLTIVADTAPLIQFADHEQNAAVKPDDILSIPVTVSDDFGVESLELHYEIKRSETVKEKGKLEAVGFQPGHQQLAHSFRIDLTQFKMQPGTLFSLRARATDERPVPEPNESWTVTRYLIVNQDAKPYGDQSLAEQQQRTDQVLEALKNELQQQKEKAKKLEEEAKQANADEEEWEKENEEQELLEKLEQLRQQMDRLTALFEQQPLFEKVAKETRDIAEGKLQEASKSIQQAQQADLSDKPEEFAKAAEQLEEAANQLEEAHEKFNQLAELQRDLLELNRLANNTERLAESVEDLETRQKQMQEQQNQSESNPQQQAQQQQWEADQRKAWQDHQDLSSTLDDLFARRPELADAAAENLQKQLEELAKRAGKLAEQQQNLAEAAKSDVQNTADQLEKLQNQQQREQMQKAAQNLAEGMQSPEQKQSAEAAQEALKNAQQAAENGDAATAAQQNMEAQQQLKQIAEQLQQAQQNATENAENGSDENKEALKSLQQQAEAAEQLQQQLEDLLKGVEEKLPGTLAAAEQLTSTEPTPTPQSGQPQTSDMSEQTQLQNQNPQPSGSPAPDGQQLMKQQEELSNLAEQIQNQVNEMTQPNEAASQSSQKFSEQAKQASQASQQIQPETASKNAQQAAQAAQSLSDSLQNSDASDSLKQAAEQAAQQQAELAKLMQAFAENDLAQTQMKSKLQQQIQEETSELANEFKQKSQELAAQPINKESESKQSQQAQQLAQQAQQQMSQASEQSQQNNQGQAQQNSEQAAKSLSEAAQQAMAASGQAGENNDGQTQPSESAVPSEVGEQVAQASQQLSAAGELLNQMGAPVPGQQQSGQESQGDDSGAQQQAMNGGEAEGQQPGQQSQKSSQQSTSEALRQAAQSMRQAAGQMAMGQSQPQPGNSHQQPEQSSNGTGEQASDFGSTQQMNDLLDLQTDLSNMSNRDWGQLPGELQTELLDSSQKKTSGEYSRLVRRYFNEISKQRSPELQQK